MVKRLVVVVSGIFAFVLFSGCPASISVPNVVGMNKSGAESAIIKAGLTVGSETYSYNAAIAAGTVLSQNPSGGVKAGSNSSVQLDISSSISNATGYIHLTSGGTLNGSGIDPRHTELTVKPGASIQGIINIETNNLIGGNAIAPLAATVDWGDRMTQFWSVDGSIPTGVKQYSVSVDK
ncbi:MAG: PASTA domain-containing protein, partial [bacterium]